MVSLSPSWVMALIVSPLPCSEMGIVRPTLLLVPVHEPGVRASPNLTQEDLMSEGGVRSSSTALLSHSYQSWGLRKMIPPNKEPHWALFGDDFLCLLWQNSGVIPSCSPHGSSSPPASKKRWGQFKFQYIAKPSLQNAKAGDSGRQAPEKGERGEIPARPLGQAAVSQAKDMHSQEEGADKLSNNTFHS